jgi:hypothetical protein
MNRWWLAILIILAASATLSPAAMAIGGCPDSSGSCGVSCTIPCYPFSGPTTASPFAMVDSVVPATPSYALTLALPPLDAPPRPLLLSA